MAQVYTAHNGKSFLSSKYRTYKTESFIKETRHFKEIDGFLIKLSESVSEIKPNANSAVKAGNLQCYILQTETKEHTFFYCYGRAVVAALGGGNTKETETIYVGQDDIIFYKYVGKDSVARRNDPSLANYLKLKQFDFFCTQSPFSHDKTDFQKLYRLSYSQYINFPLLTPPQKRIVETEDKNMLVQGVAGSGKTNVCIEKIVFSACRGYAGKVLYSTFSRGLLIDTQNKVNQFQHNLKNFVRDYEEGRIVFDGGDRKAAIENRLGIYFSVDDDDKIYEKVKKIITFLDNNVDYLLIEDIFVKVKNTPVNMAGESFFVKKYVKDIKNHQLTSKLDKLKNLSLEVIYKEIYGVILGCYNLDAPADMLSLDEYTEKRKDSFSRYECEIIHSLAKDYDAYLKKNNLFDNNLISRALLNSGGDNALYSLSVLDEVQDMTEVNLCYLKSISRKMFCVGDALQMINPTFFSFAYLKRLLFEKDIISVSELSNNYRSTRKIADLADKLGAINIKLFGSHSFVLRGAGVDSGVPTSAVFVEGGNLISELNNVNFDNCTLIVSGVEEKNYLRQRLPKQEILTVSEAKGLERETVVLYNLLSTDFDKWAELERVSVNRKLADENSVYRYYFNLFYVGVSRARSHIYAAEEIVIPAFADFFKENFENITAAQAVERLVGASNKLEAEQDEIIERLEEFIRLEQFDNARFNASKIINDSEREEYNSCIDIYENYVHNGKYKEAGIKFWELNMLGEARRQFELSKDEILIQLLDACSGGDNKGLDIDIISFLPEVENETARKLILQTVKNDLNKLTENQKIINKQLKEIKQRNKNNY